MTNFTNMKIKVEGNLEEIVAELERLGYVKNRWGGFIDDRFLGYSIRTFDNGGYTDMKSLQKYDYRYELTTLSELKAMK
jgi:hypothetical protein